MMKKISCYLIIISLILLLQFGLSNGDDKDEFNIESEFDDDAAEARYLASQLDSVEEWSLPSSLEPEEEKDEVVTEQNEINNEKSNKVRTGGNDLLVHTEENLNALGIKNEKDSTLTDIAEKKSILKKIADVFHDKEIISSLDAAKSQGSCSDFPTSTTGKSSTVCGKVPTFLGVVNWCKTSCKSGYRFQSSQPSYELCGESTKYRWTFQLRGLDKPRESCASGSSTSPLEPCTRPECFETAAYYINKIDFSKNPCDSFFEFACGRWVDETPIPPYRSRYDTYGIVRDRVNFQVGDLLEKPVYSTDSEAVAKVKVFYQSCMDIDRINMLDSQPLLNLLHSELTWPIINSNWSEDDFSFESTIATLRGKFNNKIFINIAVGKNNGTYVLQSLGPEKLLKSYLYKSGREKSLEKYGDYITDIAMMLGANKAQAQIDVRDMLELGRRLVALSKKTDDDYEGEFEVEDKKNTEKEEVDFNESKQKKSTKEIYQEMTIQEMNERISEVNWLTLISKMIKIRPVTGSSPIIVWNEKHLKRLVKVVGKTSKRTLQNFMVWCVVQKRIKNLSNRFLRRKLQEDDEIQDLPIRQYKCTQELIVSLVVPTGKLFVDVYFSKEKKKAAEELFKYVRNGFLHLLNTEVNWMDKKTKSYAKKKALAIKPYIGYDPELYENTTYMDEKTKQLKVTRNDYFGNYVRLLEIATQLKFIKLGKKYKPSSYVYKFDTRATMVNAFYQQSENAIILPSGEMQYPFYWGDAYPRTFQFGAIGTILGHEITHGFDNSGRKFGKDGELNNWWSHASLKEFKKRVKCIEDQYNNYFWELADDYLDGTNALAENIADNGGIRESYAGYHLWLRANNLKSELTEPGTGLTNDQMFFIGFANARCAKYKPDAAASEIVDNKHSPGRFRIDGSLQNFEKFSEVFNCPVGSYMNPKHKCIIW